MIEGGMVTRYVTVHKEFGGRLVWSSESPEYILLSVAEDKIVPHGVFRTFIEACEAKSLLPKKLNWSKKNMAEFPLHIVQLERL